MTARRRGGFIGSRAYGLTIVIVALLAAVLLCCLTVKAFAGSATFPALPVIKTAKTSTGATASISVSVYDDAYDTSGTPYDIFSSPLKEWSLSVACVGCSTPSWAASLELSNDNVTFTPILTHLNGTGPNYNLNQSGTMVWGPHHKAIYARVNVSSLTTGGGTLTVTAYGGP